MTGSIIKIPPIIVSARNFVLILEKYTTPNYQRALTTMVYSPLNLSG